LGTQCGYQDTSWKAPAKNKAQSGPNKGQDIFKFKTLKFSRIATPFNVRKWLFILIQSHWSSKTILYTPFS